MKFPYYRQWDLVWCNLPEITLPDGSSSKIICGRHPAVVISNMRTCASSPVVMIIPGTSNLREEDTLPGQVCVSHSLDFGLPLDTRFDTGRIMLIDVENIESCTGTLMNTPYVGQFRHALMKTFSLRPDTRIRSDEPFKRKSMLYVFCPHCGNKFVTMDGESLPKEVACRSCHQTFSTAQRYRYEVYCEKCGKIWKGETNADPAKSHVTQCRCGENIRIHYDSSEKVFREERCKAEVY